MYFFGSKNTNPCLAWFVCLLFNKPSGQWFNKIIHDKLDIDKKRMVDKTFFFSVDSTHEWILWIYFKMHSHIKHCPTWEEEKMVYATTEILMKFCCIIYHAPVFFWRLIEEQMIVRGETVFFVVQKACDLPLKHTTNLWWYFTQVIQMQ